MSLVNALSNRFFYDDRARGAAYFKLNRVNCVVETSPGVHFATVRGSRNLHSVQVDLTKGNAAAKVFCTCPKFNSGNNCKHVWAMVLAIDSALSPLQASTTTSETTSNRSPQNPVQPGLRRNTNHQAPTNRMGTNRRQVSLGPAWKSALAKAAKSGRAATTKLTDKLHASQRRVFFVIDVGAHTTMNGADALTLRLMQQERKKDGEWGQLKDGYVSHGTLSKYPKKDQPILQSLLGAASDAELDAGPYFQTTRFQISSQGSTELFRELSSSGQFYWTFDNHGSTDDLKPLVFDDKGAFTITMRLNERGDSASASAIAIVGLERQIDEDSNDAPNGVSSNEFVEMDSVLHCSSGGLALLHDRLITITNPQAKGLLTAAHNSGPLVIEQNEQPQFLEELSRLPFPIAVQFPPSWGVTKDTVRPQPGLDLRYANTGTTMLGDVFFIYGDNCELESKYKRRSYYDATSRTWIPRNTDAELELMDQLQQLPIQETTHYGEKADFQIRTDALADIVQLLGAQGWHVRLSGKQVRRSGVFTASISSGEDWFDLNASVCYDGETISLPTLLLALQNKQEFVTLADGSHGQLPPELLQRYARIAEFGEVQDDAIRFKPTQAMLLDAMLQSQENVTVDRDFQKYRKKLQSFSGIQPKSPPRGFCGELREYQTDGLGWLHFLREFQIGGCLADDMGLGKTVQVLALLESRRTRRIAKPKPDAKATKKRSTNGATKKKSNSPKQPAISESAQSLHDVVAKSPRAPSIVVVPKSLIFNWIEEAAKFTPRLRIQNYTGTDRRQRLAESDGFDVLITTYGTMRKDITDLSTIEYDYAILDESQAIKNAAAQAAKASRLLNANHRLAMTGTPVENHLGELWSLFEFLNPGMLGRSKSFASMTSGKRQSTDEHRETLEALAQSLRPFLLRRTKDQVLKDLPAKVEQTLHCEMLPAQKKQYNELKEYYRVKLAKKVETDGIKKSKIQVLEALLRLRQVACDPRLVDPKAKPGAKLEMLMQQMREVISEGHKVLVFSQFTSLLSLVKAQFNSAGIQYEYLDGKTTRRGDCVKRFQENDGISAFLISLKAGGHGLNLTSADYVFLLDPWWNPAVEAQAIDRAHRMGQKRSVTAYRLICKDTVEEKIVALQESKRELADSIITADESLIRKLTTEDLALLFS